MPGGDRWLAEHRARVARHTAAPVTRNYEYGQSVRRGRVFTLRLEPKDEETLRARMKDGQHGIYYYGRRDSLGGFIVAAALKGSAPPAAAAGNTTSSSPAKKKARR